MIVIKCFLAGILYDCFKLIYAYLNEGDKGRECYSCLRLIVQAHLHVGFFTVFFIKRASLKRFYFYMRNYFNQAQFLIKKIIMKCLAIKIFAWIFFNFQFKKCNWNSTHSYNRKVWVGIPSYIILPWLI